MIISDTIFALLRSNVFYFSLFREAGVTRQKCLMENNALKAKHIHHTAHWKQNPTILTDRMQKTPRFFKASLEATEAHLANEDRPLF